jgi:hypothetical protein
MRNNEQMNVHLALTNERRRKNVANKRISVKLLTSGKPAEGYFVDATNYTDAVMEALRKSNAGRAERLSGSPPNDFPYGAIIEAVDGVALDTSEGLFAFEVDWHPEPRISTRDFRNHG